MTDVFRRPDIIKETMTLLLRMGQWSGEVREEITAVI